MLKCGSNRSGVGLRFYISNKLSSSDSTAAGPGTTLGEAGRNSHSEWFSIHTSDSDHCAEPF